MIHRQRLHQRARLRQQGQLDYDLVSGADLDRTTLTDTR